MTAAQRQYIAAIRDEVEQRKKAENGPTLSREEWQQIADLANKGRGAPEEAVTA